MPWLFFLVMIALVVTLHVDVWDEEDPKDRSVLSGQRETIQGSSALPSGGSPQTEDYGRIPLRLRRRKNEKEELSVQDVSLEGESLDNIDILNIVPEELLHVHHFYSEGRASYGPYVGSGNLPPADAPLPTRQENSEPSLDSLAGLPTSQDTSTQIQPLPEKIEESIGTEAFLAEEILTAPLCFATLRTTDQDTQTLSPKTEDKSVITEVLSSRDQKTQTSIYVHEAGTQKDGDTGEQGTMTEKPVISRYSLQPLSINPLPGKRVQDRGTDPEVLEEEEQLPPLPSVSLHFAPLSPRFAPLHSLDISAFFKKHALENEEEIVKSEEVSKESFFLSSSSEEDMQESVVIEDKEMILKRLFPQKELEESEEAQSPKMILNLSGMISKRESDLEASWEKILGEHQSPRSLRSMSFEFIGEKEEPEDHEQGKSLPGGMILNFKKKMERSDSYEVVE